MFGAWVCFTGSIGLTTNAKEGSVLFFLKMSVSLKTTVRVKDFYFHWYS